MTRARWSQKAAWEMRIVLKAIARIADDATLTPDARLISIRKACANLGIVHTANRPDFAQPAEREISAGLPISGGFGG